MDWRRKVMHWTVVASAGLATVLVVAGAIAADRPLIDVSGAGLAPERIEVHVGEIVRWKAKGGVRMRLEFDPHRDAHEVIERAEEIRAVFTGPGEHWYVASTVGNGSRQARGVVVVRKAEADRPGAMFPACAPASSHRICFAP